MIVEKVVTITLTVQERCWLLGLLNIAPSSTPDHTQFLDNLKEAMR